MHFQSTLVASALVAFANAVPQTIVTSSASSVAPSSTVAESMPPAATQAFNIGNTTTSERFQWCLAQKNTCPQICGGAASLNSCDETTLQYSCICPNGTVPDSTAYIQTVPYFLCQQTFIQCTAANPDNAEGQQTCTDNEQCGTRNATAEALSASSASSSSSPSSTSSASGSASAASSGASASATGDSNGASMATYTSGAFAAVLMAAFKLLL